MFQMLEKDHENITLHTLFFVVCNLYHSTHFLVTYQNEIFCAQVEKFASLRT